MDSGSNDVLTLYLFLIYQQLLTSSLQCSHGEDVDSRYIISVSFFSKPGF